MSDDLAAFREQLDRERGSLGSRVLRQGPSAPFERLGFPEEGDNEPATSIESIGRRLTHDLAACVLLTALLAAALGIASACQVLHVAGGGDGAASELAGEVRMQLLVPAIAVACSTACVRMLVDIRRTRANLGRWSTEVSRGAVAAAGLAAASVTAVVALTTDLGHEAPADTATLTLIAAGAAYVGALLLRASIRSPGRLATVAISVVASVAALLGVRHGHRAQIDALKRDTARLSQAVGAGPRCRVPDATRTGRPRAWLRAELHCTFGRVQVSYLWLRTPRARGEYQHVRLAASGLTRSGGTCNDGHFEGSWTNRSTSGRLLCFRVRKSARIEWSDRAADVYSVATRRGKLVQLQRWWKHARALDPVALARSVSDAP